MAGAATPPPAPGKGDGVAPMMLVLVTIWGSAFPALKVLGGSLDPYQITWFRYVPFVVLYGAWILGTQRAQLARVSGRDWVVLGLLGFVGVVGYHFPLNWALHGTPAQSLSGAAGAIVVATVPILTLGLSVLRGHERWNRWALVGSATAFLGVLVVCLLGQQAASGGLSGTQVVVKSAVAMLAPLSWAIYTVGTKPLVGKYGSLFVTGLSLGIGELTLLPLGLRYGVAPLAHLGAAAWFWLLFLGLLSTSAGYAMWSIALKRRKPSDVAVYVYLQPVIAVVVGYFVVGERPTAWFAAGAGLVLAGVIVVNWARTRAATRQPPQAVAVAPLVTK